MADICQTCKGTRKITIFTSVEDCPDCQTGVLSAPVSEEQLRQYDNTTTYIVATIDKDYQNGWKKLRDFILGQFGISKARMEQFEKSIHPDAKLSFLEEE